MLRRASTADVPSGNRRVRRAEPQHHLEIDAFAARNPQHLDIDTSGSWNQYRQPALLCYNRDELKEFWQIFEALRLVALRA
jgi:hypothetical protein